VTSDPHSHARLHLSLADLEEVDELSARVFRAFLTTLRLHKQQMMKALSAHGMHPGQAICLRSLAAHDGITQRDLAETLHLARPTITKMLQSLERAGVVERRPDLDDQRLMRVYLTDRGRDLEAEMRTVAAEYIGATIGTLPENDRRELARLLEALGDSFARATGGGADAAGHAAGTSPHAADAP
jgi:DNA-binding MarR family transcriptional regulator